MRIDLERGRVYLPQEDLRRFGVSEDDLRAGRVTGPVRELLAYQCVRARRYYGLARQLLPREDARSLVAAEIMRGIYYGCSIGSSARTTTCSAMSFACHAPGGPLLPPAIWARSLAGLRARS